MVFGFGKKKNKDAQSAPVIRTSPSLPDLTQARQAIVWPTSLLDQEEMKQASTIPYHKPFWPYSSVGADEEGRNTSGPGFTRFPRTNEGPPSAFGHHQNRASVVSGTSSGTRKVSTRRPKLSPALNIMVVGGKQTGKTSFLRLLLETADIAPSATMEQRAELESFLAHKPKRTTTFKSARIEIMDSPTDRLMLTVIDTPGLDFSTGRELVLEQQTNALVHELDSRFAETLIEESKVIRTSKGDQHIHLCIYFIDPVTSIIDRREEAYLQQYTPPNSPPLDDVDSSESEFSDSESGPGSLSLGQKTRKAADHISLRPAELRTLRRLAPKVNLLPVIARMDCMTDARLKNVKRAVKRELEQAGIGFGVFTLKPESDMAPVQSESRDESKRPATSPQSGSEETGVLQSPDSVATPVSPVSPSDTPSSNHGDLSDSTNKPVIKIRSTRFPGELTRKRSQSRIRKAHMQSNESDEEFEIARAKASIKDALKQEQQGQKSDPRNEARKKRMSLASVRFFDHTQALLSQNPMDGGGEYVAAQREVDRLLPFALVNPERSTHRRRPTSFQPSLETDPDQGGGFDIADTSLFIRKFRWGTIDILNASHCDFVPMRTAMFGSHLKALRKSTKDAYERFRTEKLLIRKAKKMRSTMIHEDGTGNGLEANTLGSWVDVAAGTKIPTHDVTVRNGSAHGHATPVRVRTREGSAHGHTTPVKRSPSKQPVGAAI